MRPITQKDLRLAAGLVAICAAVMFLPSLSVWLGTGDEEAARIMWNALEREFGIPMLLFFLNFYVLEPLSVRWKRGRQKLAVVNVVLVGALNIPLYFLDVSHWQVDKVTRYAIYSGLLLYVSFSIVAVLLAVALRHYLRTSELRRLLREQQQRATEAELAWLKNQLNPHFLFNTLNNISSLTQIDADKAQDALSTLSDLLRYALYETRKESVPVAGELEFLRNYIDLMSLRCGDNVDIKVDFPERPTNRPIAPMLFLSPVENAFKHGVSASQPSRVHIIIREDARGIVFRAENTNYPKTTKRSGQGIGIDNLKRRLQLAYPGRHEMRQALEGRNYVVNISVQL